MPSTCDHQRLRLLLAEQLPEPLEAEAIEHVASCPRCRQELESLAGDAAWWAEVASCFVPPSPTPPFAPSPAPPFPPSSDPPESDDSFAADFAVDFLEPCGQPHTIGRIDEFEIIEPIGRGGMGIVLKGFQRDLGRYVAVKVMAPHLAASGPARKRFAREARAAAAIVHPHVMPIHSVNASARLPYLVMPYVACESLQQRLDREGPLEINQILRIGLQTALGLAAAHAQGLVHRDVKPANILLEKGVDRVLLTDFGLARAADDASLTRTGVIAGTPRYMSPEQSRGDPVDHRTDLFSLGSVMYAACTGRPPFRAETSYGVLRRICDTLPRSIRDINPDIPDWLALVVQKLQAKEPSQRIQSAGETAELLERCLAHVQQPTVVPLPDAIRSLGFQPVQHATGARCCRLVNRLEAYATPAARRFFRPALIITSVLSLALIVIVGGQLLSGRRQGDAAPAGPPAGQAALPPREPAGGSTPRAASASAETPWDDGAAEQIDGVARDIDALETAASRFWQHPAAPAAEPASETNRPKNEEVSP
ncbi:MAG: protein kinase [Pirellulales bacterium]